MFYSYFLTALRSLLKSPVRSCITVLGLSLGLASCISLLTFITYQLTFDTQFEDIDRIYQLQNRVGRGSGYVYISSLSAIDISLLKNNLVNVEKIVSLNWERVVVEGEEKFVESIHYTESEFFEVFDFSFIEGGPESVLDKPDTVVLTAGIAKKYFGDKPAIGQSLALSDRNLMVVGVIEDIADNTHFSRSQIGMLASSAGRQFKNGAVSYLKVQEPMSLDELNRQINLVISWQEGQTSLQSDSGKLSDDHAPELLAAEVRNIGLKTAEGLQRPWRGGALFHSWEFIYAAGALGFSILIISCINFINLTTAHFTLCHREIGLRKVLGAKNQHIFSQFMCETFLLTLVAVLLAFGISFLWLPWFSALLQIDLGNTSFASPVFFLGLFGLVVITVILAGFYPSVVLSRVKPAAVLAGSVTSGLKGRLRKALTVLQFAFSILMVAVCLTIYYQIKHVKEIDRGFNLENVVSVPILGASDRDAFIDQLQGHSSIHSISNTIRTSLTFGDYSYRLRGKETAPLMMVVADYNFLDFYEIDLLAGEKFSPQNRSHETSIAFGKPPQKNGGIILTLSGLEKLGFATFSDAVGEVLEIIDQGSDVDNITLEIIGVANAFPRVWQGLDTFGADYIALSENALPGVNIRLHEGQFNAGKKHIKEVLSRIAPYEIGNLMYPLQELARPGTKERVLPGVTLFAFVAIGIAVMGLYAMAAFMAQRRTREVGIRKALGASVMKITALLLWDFGKPILIALALAMPMAYLCAEQISRNMAARTPLEWIVFGVVPLIMIVIALLAVISHAAKAATVDPVLALRHE